MILEAAVPAWFWLWFLMINTAGGSLLASATNGS